MQCAAPPSTQPKKYMIGNAVTVRARLTDSDGVLVDPVNLQLIVKGPLDLSPTTLSMTVDGETAFASFLPNSVGQWWYRVETFTGPVSAAVERMIIVSASSI